LLAIFVAFCYYDMGSTLGSLRDNKVAGLSVAFILMVLVFLLLLVHIAGRRWEKQGRFSGLDT
jgi:hypothetical protein